MHVLLQRSGSILIPQLGQADLEGIITLTDVNLKEITRAHAIAMLSEVAKFSPEFVELIKVSVPRHHRSRSSKCTDNGWL
jgi:hypothetical protein